MKLETTRIRIHVFWCWIRSSGPWWIRIGSGDSGWIRIRPNVDVSDPDSKRWKLINFSNILPEFDTNSIQMENSKKIFNLQGELGLWSGGLSRVDEIQKFFLIFPKIEQELNFKTWAHWKMHIMELQNMYPVESKTEIPDFSTGSSTFFAFSFSSRAFLIKKKS